MIMAARRPLLMFGAAASRPRVTPDVAQFVLRTQIPYFTTQMGKGTVPGGTELYMGTAALSERDYVHEAIEQADLIITIGHDTVEKPPFIMGAKGPDGHPCRLSRRPMSSRSISRRPRSSATSALRSRCWPTGSRARSPTRRRCCRCGKAF